MITQVNKELVTLFSAYRKEIGMHASNEAAAHMVLAHVMAASRAPISVQERKKFEEQLLSIELEVNRLTACAKQLGENNDFLHHENGELKFENETLRKQVELLKGQIAT